MMRNQTKKPWTTKYGPWAVVTGASSGIGRELAKEIASRGLNVVLVARRHKELEELARELKDDHVVQTRVIRADFTKESEYASLDQQTQDLDVGLLVAAAGYGSSGHLCGGSIANELEMLQVNCSSVLTQSMQFSRRFVERGSGGIILFSSIVGFHGVPNATNYAATKAYIQSLAEGLQAELSTTGVDVLAVAPGPTRTGFAERAGMTMSSAMTSEAVARRAIAALGRRTTLFPGFMPKLITYSLALLPRWARIRIMGNVMKSMTQPTNQEFELSSS